MNYKKCLFKLKNSNFFKDFSIIYFSSLISSTFGFLTNFLIIKLAGFDIYGKLVTLQIVTKIVITLASGKTNELTIRFIRKSLDKMEYSKAKFFLMLGFFVDLITLLFFLILLKFLAKLFAIWFLKSSKFYVYIWFQGIIESFLILRGNLLGFLMALHKFKLLAYISVFESFLRLSLLAIFLVIFKNLHLKYILLIYLITTVLINIWFFINFYIIYKENFADKEGISFSSKDLKEYLNFFVRNFAILILKAVNLRIEYLFFSYFFNATLVGLYDFIKKLFLPYNFALRAITKISYPRFVSIYIRNKSLKNFILKITTYLILIYLGYIIVVSFLFKKILGFLEIQDYIANFLFLFISFLIFLETITWWTRNFSATVNLKYSLVENFILLINFFVLWLIFNFVPKTEINLMIGISLVYFITIIYWLFIFKKSIIL